MQNLNERIKKIKLLVSDLDGTLLTTKSTLSPFTKEKVDELRAQGIEFAIATGRVEAMAALFQHQLNLSMPLISCNGAMISNPFTKEIFHLQAMSVEQAMTLYKFYVKENLDFLIYTTEGICYRQQSQRMQVIRYYQSVCKAIDLDLVKTISFEEIGDDEAIRAFLSREGLHILKIFVRSGEREHLKRCLEETQKVEGINAVASWTGSFDVMVEGVNKGEAVKKLAEMYGYTIDEVACFGDHDNDSEMLDVAGLAYTPKNALYHLKEKADIIFESNSAEGLARVIEQDFLKKV